MDKKKFHSVVMGWADELNYLGYPLPDSLKRRDKREPGRELKESLEDRLQMVIRRYFKKQLARLKERLEQNYPARKDNTIPPIPIDDIIDSENDDEFMADIVRVVGLATVGGVNLFKESIMIGLDYTLINDKALDFARTYSYDLINKNKGGIDATTRDAVSKAITRFVDTPGFTLGDIMDQLSDTFSLERARRIAVTETTRAFAEGNQIAGKQLKEEYPDVKVIKRWYVNNDDRLCIVCSLNENEEVEINDKFSSGDDAPPAHVNCLPGDALILSGGAIFAGSERWYEGDIITIETLENKLTVTPNHPILTNTGWVPAGQIKQGDYIFGYGARDWESPFISIDKQNRKSTIKDIFSSLDLNGLWMPTSAPDFHGDGSGSDIAVIRSNSKVVGDTETIFNQPLTKNNLTFGNIISEATLPALGAETKLIEGNVSIAGSIVSGFDLAQALLGRHVLPLHQFGFGLSSGIYTSINQSLSKSPSVYSRLISKAIFGFTGNISLQQVAKIRNNYFSGHVYNLQTESGLFAANGIITHNCRCWMDISTKI